VRPDQVLALLIDEGDKDFIVVIQMTRRHKISFGSCPKLSDDLFALI
jgi:hypothetical protein